MGTPPEWRSEERAVAATDDVDVQTQRIEALLATVHDLVSSLRHVSGQLDREIASALDGAARADLVKAAQAENAQLREAAETRAVIEQAKGMMIARFGCDADRAFAMLSEMSRTQRRKVRDVAAALVREALRSPNARVVDLAGSAKPAAAPSAAG